MLGKTQADFVKDLGFVLGGTVYGTFKYVTGFTNFNASVPEEQEGGSFADRLASAGHGKGKMGDRRVPGRRIPDPGEGGWIPDRPPAGTDRDGGCPGIGLVR